MAKLDPQMRIPFLALQLAYTPDNDRNQEKITAVNDLLGLVRPPVGFASPEEMQKSLYDSSYLAGIEINIKDNTNFEFALRFPGQCRFGTDVPMIRNWNTGLNFPRSQSAGPRNPKDAFGGSPAGYVEEGFIALQMALYKVYFCKADLPKIFLQV